MSADAFQVPPVGMDGLSPQILESMGQVKRRVQTIYDSITQHAGFGYALFCLIEGESSTAKDEDTHFELRYSTRGTNETLTRFDEEILKRLRYDYLAKDVLYLPYEEAAIGFRVAGVLSEDELADYASAQPRREDAYGFDLGARELLAAMRLARRATSLFLSGDVAECAEREIERIRFYVLCYKHAPNEPPLCAIQVARSPIGYGKARKGLLAHGLKRLVARNDISLYMEPYLDFLLVDDLLVMGDTHEVERGFDLAQLGRRNHEYYAELLRKVRQARGV